MLIYNAVIHPMDAPLLERGFLQWEGRTITRLVEDKFAEAILKGDLKAGDTVIVNAGGDRILLEKGGEQNG